VVEIHSTNPEIRYAKHHIGEFGIVAEHQIYVSRCPPELAKGKRNISIYMYFLGCACFIVGCFDTYTTYTCKNVHILNVFFRKQSFFISFTLAAQRHYMRGSKHLADFTIVSQLGIRNGAELIDEAVGSLFSISRCLIRQEPITAISLFQNQQPTTAE
jgi:hypothetical protein